MESRERRNTERKVILAKALLFLTGRWTPRQGRVLCYRKAQRFTWCYARGDIFTIWGLQRLLEINFLLLTLMMQHSLMGSTQIFSWAASYPRTELARISQPSPQALFCICSSWWQSKAEQNLAWKVETTKQLIKVINLCILIVSSHALLCTTFKTNAISCHCLRKPSMTVTVQIILFYFIRSWMQRNWKKKKFYLRETMEIFINKRKFKGGLTR